jgi:hypothetical protein
MKTIPFVLIPWCFLVASINCFGQDSTTHQTVFRSGIDLQGGVGYLAIRDDHISNERYAGSSSWLALNWSRFHETYGFRIGMIYQKASNIKNFNVSAEVTKGAFNLVNLYPIGNFGLVGKDVFAYLGPSADVIVYYRRQNIAQNTDATPDVYESGAWLFSLGGRLEMILPVQTGLQVESSLQMSLLSFGGGTGSGSGQSTPIRLLTALAGMNSSAEIGLRYYPFWFISLAGGYKLEITRISSWNYILSSSDNAFVSVGYHF